MSLEWYADDDTPLAGTTEHAFGTVTAGTESAAVERHLWLHKGASTGTTQTSLYLQALVEDPDAPGTWLSSGLDALDRREVQVRITGSQNPDVVADFDPFTTGWVSLGKGSILRCPPLARNCCIEVEMRYAPGLYTGSSDALSIKLRAVADEALPSDQPGEWLRFAVVDPSSVVYDQARLSVPADCRIVAVAGHLRTPFTGGTVSDLIADLVRTLAADQTTATIWTTAAGMPTWGNDDQAATVSLPDVAELLAGDFLHLDVTAVPTTPSTAPLDLEVLVKVAYYA